MILPAQLISTTRNVAGLSFTARIVLSRFLNTHCSWQDTRVSPTAAVERAQLYRAGSGSKGPTRVSCQLFPHRARSASTKGSPIALFFHLLSVCGARARGLSQPP